MPEEQSPIQPQENPFRQLSPVEANTTMQEIFALIPVNASPTVHSDDPTLAQRRAESILFGATSARLALLMEVSQFTHSGQQRAIEKFQNGFMQGRTPPDTEKAIPDNAWSEEFGWDDSSGGSFGGKAKDLEFRIYRHDLAIAQIANKSTKKIIEDIKESSKPEEQSLRERAISQEMINEALGEVPENPKMVALRKWRSELIEKWNDEP